MSVDNRIEHNDCEIGLAAGGWSGDGPTPDIIGTVGQFYQGSNAIESQHDDGDEQMHTTEETIGDAVYSIDVTDQTWYFQVKDNLLDTYGNRGVQGVFGDGTELIGYRMGGNDAQGMPMGPFYNAFKVDMSVYHASPGTVNVDFHEYVAAEADNNLAAVTQVGIGTDHLAKAVGNVNNIFIDYISYIANDSFALTINGGTSGTPETMVDVAGDDVTNGWGMVSNPFGSQYIFFAPTEWGEDAALANHFFEAFDEQWFFMGDNAGGHAVGATHFPFRVIGNATDTGEWRITRVVIVNIGTRAQFDLSSADMDEMQIVASVFTDLGAITMPPVDAAAKFCNDSVFNNCDQMDLSSLDMDGNTWNGTTDAGGAIVWDENTGDVANQDNSTFVRDAVQNAIEIAPTGAGPFTYNIDGYTFDGYASQDDPQATEAEKVFFINPSTLSADININLSNSQALNIGRDNADDTGTNGFSFREVGSYTGTVTITATVTLSVQVNDDSGNPLEDVFVSIRNAATNALISEGRTTVAGLYQDTGFNYTADTDVTINVRKSSPGDTRYLPKADANEIVSTGMSAIVTMTPDPLAGVIDSTRFDISKHGVISNDVNGATITAKILLPAGTKRKLVVAGLYWDSTVNRTVTTFTYDGGGMTDTLGGNFVQEGSNFHEIFLYRHDIPDADSGVKDVVLTLSGDAPFRAIAFAIINLAAAGAEEDDGNSVGQAVTTNPSISLNNTTQPAIDVMFSLTDDLDTFPPAASGVGSIRRADRAVDTEKQITIIRADRTTTGAHSLGADYDASSKSYVSAAATFAD